jgi:hypothetical protein
MIRAKVTMRKNTEVRAAYLTVSLQKQPAQRQCCLSQGGALALTIYQVTTESQGSQIRMRKQALSTWNSMGGSHADA